MKHAVMTLAALEAALYALYATASLEEAVLAYRAELAHEYRARTGTWFAARYY
jgi:hypothetical protein